MDTIQENDKPRQAQSKPVLAKLRCAHCMKLWKQAGKDPEKLPKAFSESELLNKYCPVCGRVFNNYTPF